MASTSGSVPRAGTPPDDVDEDDEDDVPLSRRVMSKGDVATVAPTQPDTGTATPQLFDSSMESDTGGLLLSQVSEAVEEAILHKNLSPPPASEEDDTPGTPQSPTPPPPPPVDINVRILQHGEKTQTTSPRPFPRVTVEKLPVTQSQRPTVRRGRYKFN